MSDMNYLGALVKMLEPPKQKIINNILCVTFRAQLPQIRQTRIVEIVCWGNLAQSILNNYKVNDYLLIEGYISFREKSTKKKGQPFKRVIITVLKVHPFLLNYRRSMNKLS